MITLLKLYEYTVEPENMCPGLKMVYDETGQTRFRGYRAFAPYYNAHYYTVDGITHTPERYAVDVVEVKSEV
jgi:hypothetical protein